MSEPLCDRCGRGRGHLVHLNSLAGEPACQYVPQFAPGEPTPLSFPDRDLATPGLRFPEHYAAVAAINFHYALVALGERVAGLLLRPFRGAGFLLGAAMQAFQGGFEDGADFTMLVED